MKVGIIKAMQLTTNKTISSSVKKIKSRKYPNWLGLPGENFGNTVGYKIAFYPEDMEKMKSMTKEEARSYRARLVADHKYYKDTSYRPMPEILKTYFAEHNINIDDFIVK